MEQALSINCVADKSSLETEDLCHALGKSASPLALSCPFLFRPPDLSRKACPCKKDTDDDAQGYDRLRLNFFSQG